MPYPTFPGRDAKPMNFPMSQEALTVITLFRPMSLEGPIDAQQACSFKHALRGGTV